MMMPRMAYGASSALGCFKKGWPLNYLISIQKEAKQENGDGDEGEANK
jgi:hypothetical protein